MNKKIQTLLFVISLNISIIYGQSFIPLGSGFNLLSEVRTLYYDSTLNLLYAGGTFNSSANNPLFKIAVWNGVIWDSLGSGANGTVNSITKYNNSIYAGGSFSIMGGVVCNGLARWDGANWHFVASFLNSNQNPSVIGLYQLNGNLYVIGGFTSLDTIPANGIAKYDGTNWSVFPILAPGGSIFTVIEYNNELYVGGNFSGPPGMKDIAKYDGLSWNAVGTGLSGANTWVNKIQEFQNQLYVAGYFQTANGDPGNNIAIWNGSNWSQAGGGLLPSNVWDIYEFQNELYAGGQINDAGGLPVHYIAKWDGATWLQLPGNPVFSNSVHCFTAVNNSLFIGGGFNTINGTSMNKITEYDYFVSDQINSNDNIKILQIVPNPATNIIHLSLPNDEYISGLKIFDTIGRKNYQSTFDDMKNELTVDISQLQPGMYFVNVETQNKQSFLTKLVLIN